MFFLAYVHLQTLKVVGVKAENICVFVLFTHAFQVLESPGR